MGRDRPGGSKRKPAPARPQGARPAGDGDAGRARPPSVREAVGEVKPTPVRDSVEAPPPPPASVAGSPPEQRTLSVEGTEWVVRVRGRGRAGTDTGPAPLLVLGFFRSASGEVPDREALVVARSLEELSARQLEGALRVSRPPPEPGAKKELFPETASKGRGGRGEHVPEG